MKDILVPVDGSAHSKKALEFACDLANKFDARLHLLYVAPAPVGSQTMVLGLAGMSYKSPGEDLRKIGHDVINAAATIARKQGCTLANTLVECGSPPQHILDYAEKNDADMIVMGSRGLSNIGGMLLGSVSHNVTHLAECTCVTVR